MYAQMNKVCDMKQYVVLMDRSGHPHYCMEHWSCSFTPQGAFLGLVNSFIELPKSQPLPPYVEGHEIDEATILYGYKMTPREEQLPWKAKMTSMCQQTE